ncbi:MAG: VCBS domain-containing protein [Gemmatimonas sp.]
MSGKTTTTATTAKTTLTFKTADLTGLVREDDTLAATGTLNAVDSDPTATLTWSVAGGGIGTYGKLVVDQFGHWTYLLNNDSSAVQSMRDGDVARETFTVQVVDSSGTSSSQKVTVNVAGTNDAPVISAAPGQDMGAVQEDGVLTASGQLTAFDPDKGSKLVWSVANAGVGTYGKVTVDPNGAWTYQLDNTLAAVQDLGGGDTLTDKVAVLVTDDTGLVTSKEIAITIAGNPDLPTVTGAVTGSVTEDGLSLNSVGQLTAQGGDPVPMTWSVENDGVGTYGTLHVFQTGLWSYTLNNASDAVQALNNNDHVHDIFTVDLSDNHGGVVSTQIDITVNGQNEPDSVVVVPPPVVAPPPPPVVAQTPFTTIDPATASQQADAIIHAVLGNASGITADPASLHVVGDQYSIGFYDGSLAPLGIGPGLLLTTGHMPFTWNSSASSGWDNALAGDADLDAVVNSVFHTVGYDASTVEFGFDVTDPTVTGIHFNVALGSDEFPEWVNQYVDIGAVIVNGVNVAYFNNNPTAPLSIIGSNLSANYFLDNTDGHLPIEYDGMSNVLSIFAPVQFGHNTIKIGVEDTGDHALDTGLFISNLTATDIPTSGIGLDVYGTNTSDTETGTQIAEVYDLQAGDDVVYAMEGNDVVYGGAGNDYIDAGKGADYLSGGAGADVFVYESTLDSAPTAMDTILDFNSVDGDKIDFSQIDAVSGGTDDAFTVVDTFTGTAGELTIASQGTWYLVSGDTDGDGVADLALHVTSASTIVASDFVL